MRARFTDCIASVEGWSYGHGKEVSVAGEQYTDECVPESVGRVWLSTGLLEPVGVATETATLPSTRTAAIAASAPRARRR